MAHLVRSLVEMAHHFRWASIGGNPPDGARSPGSKEDAAVRGPGSTPRVRRLAQHIHRRRGKRDLLEVAVGEEPQPPAIRRKERAVAAFGADERGRREPI